jgi:hypothetical protein
MSIASITRTKPWLARCHAAFAALSPDAYPHILDSLCSAAIGAEKVVGGTVRWSYIAVSNQAPPIHQPFPEKAFEKVDDSPEAVP